MSAPDSAINHEDAINYWNNVDSTVDGVLGGYPQISRADLRGSQTFLNKLKGTSPLSSKSQPTGRPERPFGRVVDCGAGIGRVTAGCLSRVASVVDVVEPVAKFADKAAALAADELGEGSRIGHVYRVGLEAWTPDPEAYDVIWNQWCLGQLTDRELVDYLVRCKRGIKKDGWICVKENLNTAEDGSDLFDELDSSVTRSDDSFNRVFAEAGLKVVAHEIQKGFPKQLGLYPVKTYALRPA